MEGVDKFNYIEKDAENSPVKDIQWHGQEVEFGGIPVQDSGKGKPIFIRTFDFARQPGVQLPSEKEIAEGYEKFIDTFLWKDSLVRLQDLKVVVEKERFRIFATCQAKQGAVILDKPLTIQDYASK